jgi:hypothetical protein
MSRRLTQGSCAPSNRPDEANATRKVLVELNVEIRWKRRSVCNRSMTSRSGRECI